MSQLKVLSLNSSAWNRCYVLIYFRYRERKKIHTCYSSVITDQFTKTSKIGSCLHFCVFFRKVNRSVKRFRNKKAFQYDAYRPLFTVRGLCPGVSVSGGLCVRGGSVQGSLSKGCLLKGESVQRGLYSGGSLCRVGSLSRGSLSRETPSPCEQNNTQV